MVQNKYSKRAWIYCGVVLLAFSLFIPVLTREVKERTNAEISQNSALVDSLNTSKDATGSGTEDEKIDVNEDAIEKDSAATAEPEYAAPETAEFENDELEVAESEATETGKYAPETYETENAELENAKPDLAAEQAVKPADVVQEEILQQTTEPLPQVDIKEIIWPLKGEVIREVGLSYSQTFSDYRYHNGIDIKAERGAQAVMSLPGKVIKKETTKDNGLVLTFEHGQQDNVVWRSVYAHLSETILREGDSVEAGAVVGIIDQPGYNEIMEGPHLHYSLYQNEQVVNPLDYLP